MPPTNPKLAKTLDIIIEKAEALRKVGVLSFDVEGCKFVLAPIPEQLVEVPLPTANISAGLEKHMDALDDPETFGGSEGTPGYYSGTRQGSPTDGERPLDA